MEEARALLGQPMQYDVATFTSVLLALAALVIFWVRFAV